MSDNTINSEKELLKALNKPDTAERIARNEKLRKTGMKLVLVVGGAALTLTALCIPFCLPAARKICVPYVPATPVQINNILQCLKTHSVPNAKVIDIGSGDGRVCISCAKEGYKSTGVELNSVLWVLSNIKKYTNRVSQLCTFRRKNLFNEDLSKYDAITVFGAPTLMQALEPKVAKEASDTTKLIVCRYPFLKWAPNYTYGNGIDSVWVYHKPFKMNKTLPPIYHDLVEFAEHPLHPSNVSEMDVGVHIKEVTDKIHSTNDNVNSQLSSEQSTCLKNEIFQTEPLKKSQQMR